jgi:integrase
VFPRHDGKPDLKLWRASKAIAKRVSLDPDRVWLHKFRATGATRYFQRGVPLPDIMALGGWRDIKSVQRYMGLLRDDGVAVGAQESHAAGNPMSQRECAGFNWPVFSVFAR